MENLNLIFSIEQSHHNTRDSNNPDALRRILKKIMDHAKSKQNLKFKKIK